MPATSPTTNHNTPLYLRLITTRCFLSRRLQFYRRHTVLPACLLPFPHCPISLLANWKSSSSGPLLLAWNNNTVCEIIKPTAYYLFPISTTPSNSPSLTSPVNCYILTWYYKIIIIYSSIIYSTTDLHSYQLLLHQPTLHLSPTFLLYQSLTPYFLRLITLLYFRSYSPPLLGINANRSIRKTTTLLPYF